MEQAKSKCSKGVAKCQFGFTFKEVSNSFGNKQNTRPYVNCAKDWPDQSFPFLAWSGVVLYGLVKADCLYHDIWQFFAAWWHFLSVILVAGS